MTANRHYRDDPRDFLVLTVDLDATGSPWRFDDPDRIYPHVYGPIASSSVVRAVPIPVRPTGRSCRSSPSDIPAGITVERIFVVEADYGPDAERSGRRVRPEHLDPDRTADREGRVIEAGGYLDFSTALLLVRAD